MNVYPCEELKMRIVQEGKAFILEQDCGSAGWWFINRYTSIANAKKAFGAVRKKFEEKKNRKQVWPVSS
jgi:hypothetical protein